MTASGAGGTVVDAVVLGLGVHGSATAYELSTRGASVIGIERFAAGHDRGSSHGATRMIRRAYPSEQWNGFVDRAYAGWDRWSAASGRPFLHTTGGLYAHRGVGGLQGGRGGPVSPAEASYLMPSLVVPEGYHAFHDPEAGVVEAESALVFAREQAIAHGAELSFGEQVLSWQADAGGVRVRTDRRELMARRLVVAAGPWVSRFVPAYSDRFEVWRMVTLAAPVGQEVARAPRLGAFSVDLPEGLVFALPEAGGHGAKMGVDVGAVWDPERPVDRPTADEIGRLVDLFGLFVPQVRTDGAEAVACLYTMTEDRRFVLGELPGQPGVVLAAACSGHGFKFGPAVGEAVADAVEGVSRPDLKFLSPSRWDR